jgi:hypothetical protein
MDTILSEISTTVPMLLNQIMSRSEKTSVAVNFSLILVSPLDKCDGHGTHVAGKFPVML